MLPEKEKQINKMWEEKETEKINPMQVDTQKDNSTYMDFYKNIKWVYTKFGGYLPFYITIIGGQEYIYDIYRDFIVTNNGDVKVNSFLETKN